MKRTIQRMDFRKLGSLIVVLLIGANLFAQTSPYAISPKWYFGMQAGMDFTGGSPVVMNGNPSGLAGSGQEASSTMCDPSGNVIFYTDSYVLYDGNNNSVQNINGGTSSTNSSVCFPDPASPTTDFYLVTANQDPSGGGNHTTLGIYYYKIHKTGPGTISVTAGPVLLASNAVVTEQLCGGSDGNGGYWVATHQLGGNQIWSWHFTAGGVSATQTSSVAGTETNPGYNGSIKIDRCQDKIAMISKTGVVEVYSWDQTTGMVTGLLRTTALGGGAFGYGCEFSPNGNMLYLTELSGHSLIQWDLGTNVFTTLAVNSPQQGGGVNEMGTLQLGPNGKIYFTSVPYFVQPNYVSVINNPDISGVGCNYVGLGFLLNNSVGNYPSTYRGIANEAWINPTQTIDTTGNCKTIGFSYKFNTYFDSTIAVVPNSQQWDFGDNSGVFVAGLGPTPTHTYANGGSYTIRMKVTDAACGQVWTTAKTIVVNNCSVPPVCPTDPTSASVDRNNFCNNGLGKIKLTSSGGTGDSLAWYTGSCGGTYIGKGTPLSIPSPTVNTTYYARWEGGGGSCSPSNCQSVAVTVVPTPTPAIVGVTSSCANLPLSYSTTDNSGSGNTYLWTSTGGISLNAPTNAANISAAIGSSAGTISVTETAGSCSTKVSQPISIIPATSPASAGTDKNLCVSSYTLNGNNPVTGSGTWSIVTGTGIFSPTPDTYNATVSGLSNGANEFVWTITGACGVKTDTVVLTVGANALKAKAITSPDTVCFGSAKDIQVMIGGGSGNYTYIWTSSDNSFTQTGNNASVTVNPAGYYTKYYLTVLDNKNTGCNSGDTVGVYALPDQDLVVPNLVTPNGDNKNDYLEIKDKNELKILPGSSLQINNRWGERIYDNSSYDNSWNAPNISDGVYYYYLKSGCGNKLYKGWIQIVH